MERNLKQPTKSTRQGCQLFHYLFNILLKVLVRAINQQKEVKGIQIKKKEVKISLFADDTIVYLSAAKIPPENFKNPVNNFRKVG